MAVKVRDRYPVGTVREGKKQSGAARGGCFFTGQYEIPKGERIIDTRIDLENRPGHGLVCLSELAVRQFCQALGWEIDTSDRVAELEEQLAEVKAERDLLAEHLQSVTAAFDVARAFAETSEPSPERPADEQPPDHPYPVDIAVDNSGADTGKPAGRKPAAKGQEKGS